LENLPHMGRRQSELLSDGRPVRRGDLYRVTAPGIVAGFIAHQGVVVTAAPILHRYRGMRLSLVLIKLSQRGWRWGALGAARDFPRLAPPDVPPKAP